MADNMVLYHGLDANGHKRVFATGYGRKQAANNCFEAAQEYVVGRPDTGPLSGWHFKLVEDSAS